jgi:ataxia telangiectasia mutated family protein
MLTRILTLGNIVVASSAVRRGPYWHLLEICLHPSGKLYHRHIVAVLFAVSERMGLAPSTLFEVYASQIAYSIRQAGHDFLQFPPSLLGYKDRRQCAERNFRAFTPTNVLAGGSDRGSMSHGQKLFLNHCRAVQKSTAAGLRECFGDIIGIQIVSLMDEHQQNPAEGVVDGLENVLRMKTTSIADFGNFDEVLNENIDEVVAAILRTLGDQDFSDDGLIMQTLLSVDVHKDAAHTFRELLRHRRADSLVIHEPNLPSFPSTTILPALDWLSRWRPSTQTHATTYHVMHELFADIERSPFVNEQIRLLTALCLWIAIRHHEFQNSTLLHTLIQGASSLLAQYDLAPAVQSMLEWSFTCYRKNAIKDPRFPDVLIRISCMAYDYTRSNSTSTSELGKSLLQWVDHQAFLFCKITTLRVQVSKALAAWPHHPSPELAQIYKDITSETLSALLTDHTVSANKFRLVRRLQDLAEQHNYGEGQFSTADFWRLKACIPPPNQLQDSDIDAFATLLILNKGRIHSFGSEQYPIYSVRVRHHRAVRKQAGKTPGASVSPQYSIVMSLLAMLDSSSISQAHMAYRTLRFIVSAPDLSTVQSELWPSEYSSELEFLQTYARTAAKRPHPDLDGLLRSEDFLVLTNFPEWVCRLAVFLSDIIAASNPFFSHLATILQSDVEFAEQMLPILIHSLLTSDGRNAPSPRIAVSQYLNRILATDNASVPCLRTVVETVLHLRNFQPHGATDALAYDKWLLIDFTLLARKAVTCGAYTTALLFLELAAEYRDSSVQDDLPVEQILFDIYSHIDEPDGFYGIQTNDLRHFLIKRFHHENQWEKAFRFHGAALQADKTDSSAAGGVLQSFHAFGFDHLAIDTLQGSSLGNPPTNGGASHMSYQLGWRTETWDLPDPVAEMNSANSLYLALRAIHRERDPSRADTVLRQGLSREMRKLRELGSESIAEIHEVTRTLMCLHQITRWKQAPIQERLASKAIHIHDWEDFLNIPGDFE